MAFLSFKPLRRRLLLLFAIALFIPAAFGIYAAYEDYKDQLARIWQAQGRYATLAGNYESNLFWQTDRLVDALVKEQEVIERIKNQGGNEKLSANCTDLFRLMIKPYPAYLGITLYDLDGQPLCTSYPENSHNAINDKWFMDMLQYHKPIVSKRMLSPDKQEPILTFGGMVMEKNTIIGIVGIDIRLNWLAAIGQEPGLPVDSSVYLMDNSADVLVSFSSPDSDATGGLPDEQYRKEIVSHQLRKFEAQGADGNRRLYTVFPIRETGPYILMGRSWNEIVAPAQQSLTNQLIAWLAVSIMGFAAALLGARFLVTQWTEKLAKAARNISQEMSEPFPDLKYAPIEFRELGAALEYAAKKITDRENELQESVAQKQIMMREIHHRVKNNLQIVTSLLNVYARKPNSDAIKQAFSDIQVRINTLALVHRHLYESQDLQAINLAPFMTNLCNLLYDGCGVSSRRIRLLVDIPAARVNGDRAVPLALLTTELLTNAFKHAFPDNRSGTIRVKMRLGENGDACLIIADDGIGAESVGRNSGRFKMGEFLIDALTKQLGGWIEKSGPPGCIIHLYFNLYTSITPSADTSEKGEATEYV